ncbi:hypothetical protein MAR_002072, partial [Mya arenaria]
MNIKPNTERKIPPVTEVERQKDENPPTEDKTPPPEISASKVRQNGGAKSVPPPTRPYSVFEIAKNPELAQDMTKRPATALSLSMSAKTYTQSYSFSKDGMNIGLTRRERFMRTKSLKEKSENNSNVVFEHEKNKDRYEFEEKEDNPGRDNFLESIDKENNKFTKKLALSTSPGQSLESRKSSTIPSKHGNTLRTTPTATKTSVDLYRANTPSVHVIPARVSSSLNTEPFDDVDGQFHHEQKATSADGTLRVPGKPMLRANSTLPQRRSGTPLKTVVTESRLDSTGHKSPISVRITQTVADTPMEHDRGMYSATPRPDTSFDHIEEELIPLTDDDNEHLNKLTGYRGNDNTISRLGAKSAIPFKETEKIDLLHVSAEKAETFLKDYSKKSKIFGYVVKTRTSTIAPKERLRSYRSPCITYQELVSIKANIRQHQAHTKTLLQSSAKLSSYVDTLANASL